MVAQATEARGPELLLPRPSRKGAAEPMILLTNDQALAACSELVRVV